MSTNSNEGYPPGYFQLSPDHGGESDATEDDRVSPVIFLENSNTLEVAQQLALYTPELSSVIQGLLQGDRTLEIPDDRCAAFNATPDGPNYTCGIFNGNGRLCTTGFTRLDRFKHHLQAHLGITPYSCMASPKSTVEPKCDKLFSTIAARDTHVRNKGGPVMRACGTSVLPKNFARHRTTCSTCLANPSLSYSTLS